MTGVLALRRRRRGRRHLLCPRPWVGVLGDDDLDLSRCRLWRCLSRAWSLSPWRSARVLVAGAPIRSDLGDRPYGGPVSCADHREGDRLRALGHVDRGGVDGDVGDDRMTGLVREAHRVLGRDGRCRGEYGLRRSTDIGGSAGRVRSKDGRHEKGRGAEPPHSTPPTCPHRPWTLPLGRTFRTR